MPKYINADALLAEAKRISGPFTGEGWDNFGVYALIERQPAADVKPVIHSKWVINKEDLRLCCQNCETVPSNKVSVNALTIYYIKNIKEHMLYCPKCGAKMDEEEDDA